MFIRDSPYLLKVRERFLVCLTFYTLLFMWVLFYNIYYQDLFSNFLFFFPNLFPNQLCLFPNFLSTPPEKY